MEVPFDSVGVDEPSCEGLRTCGVWIRRLCAEGSAREGLTLQLEPIYRWVLLAEKGIRHSPRGFPKTALSTALVTPFKNPVKKNIL